MCGICVPKSFLCSSSKCFCIFRIVKNEFTCWHSGQLKCFSLLLIAMKCFSSRCFWRRKLQEKLLPHSKHTNDFIVPVCYNNNWQSDISYAMCVHAITLLWIYRVSITRGYHSLAVGLELLKFHHEIKFQSLIFALADGFSFLIVGFKFYLWLGIIWP